MTSRPGTNEAPRTLIVSEAPFGAGHGFGVTLSTLFEEWPSGHVQLLYTRETSGESADGRFRSTFADVPGHWGRRYALEYLLGRRPSWRGRYSARWLQSVLGDWTPDVVYSFVFSGETLAFAAWTAEQFGCPLVAHVADDGLEETRAGVARDVRSLLSAAARRLSISEEMRAEYLRRYGLDSDVLHNGAGDELFARQAPPRGTRPFVVRYLGSVVPGHHYHAIEDVAAAVRALAASGIPVQFELCGGRWTHEHAERLADGDAVVYRGEVSKTDGIDLLKSADLLVVPITFDPSTFRNVRLSLPTKLPEYLASGTPTLVYGPRGSAPVEFCRRHDVGAVIDERSVEGLSTFMRRLISASEPARTRARRDAEFVRSRYSAAAIRERFQEIVRAAVEGA